MPGTRRALADWVSTKTRWGLTVDQAEHDALTRGVAACPDLPLTVQPAQ